MVRGSRVRFPVLAHLYPVDVSFNFPKTIVTDNLLLINENQMNTNEYIILCMNRAKDMLNKSIQGLTLDQALIFPSQQSNNIVWIIWHMTRGFDRRISLIAGDEQTWISEKWYIKYNLPNSASDLGIGHTMNDVKKIIPNNISVLTEYYESVHNKMLKLLNDNQKISFNNIIVETENTQKYELMRMVAGTLQHVGQINYIKGLIVNRIWYTGNILEKR